MHIEKKKKKQCANDGNVPMCQYDNMPIVEEMQAQAQAKAKWIIDIGLLDFRQKNKDACGK